MNLKDKILFQGASALSKRELLAVLFNEYEIGEQFLKELNSFICDYNENELVNLPSDVIKLSKEFNVSLERSYKLTSLIEFLKRYSSKIISPKFIRNQKEAYEYFKNLQYLKKEYLKGIYLNNNNKIIYEQIISIGDPEKVILSPFEIFKPAFEYNAQAIILAHNHPSGDSKASFQDILTTKKISKCSYILNIKLLDHLIIGSNSYTSLKNLKVIK